MLYAKHIVLYTYISIANKFHYVLMKLNGTVPVDSVTYDKRYSTKVIV